MTLLLGYRDQYSYDEPQVDLYRDRFTPWILRICPKLHVVRLLVLCKVCYNEGRDVVESGIPGVALVDPSGYSPHLEQFPTQAPDLTTRCSSNMNTLRQQRRISDAVPTRLSPSKKSAPSASKLSLPLENLFRAVVIT